MSASTQRVKLYSLLGELPDPNLGISCTTLSIEQREHYQLEKLVLTLNGIEEVPAYFARPNTEGPFACMLYNHAHGGNYDIGKTELISGGEFLSSPPYAEELAKMNIATLCIDHWCFGERRGLKESEVFKEMLWRGKTLWGMMVFDSIKAIEYLSTRIDIDSDRIGTIGMSMGSTMAWWLAALDERIKICVDICCLTDFETLIETRGLDEHGVYYYVPSLLKHFSTSAINALICPRPHLSLAGTADKLTPPAGLDKIDRYLNKIYSDFGAQKAWCLKRYDTGHVETTQMRSEILAFITEWL